MAEVGVVGAGYVGLTTAVCMARLGHVVHATDLDHGRVAELRAGRSTMDEPGTAELLAEGLAAGRLTFGTDPAGHRDAEVVFLCLPTPAGPYAGVDLGPFDAALRELADVLAPGAVVVTKSTVPVGTTGRVAATLGRPDVAAVSNPEFLREGHTVEDFLRPSRIVVGADDHDAGSTVAALYDDLGAPLVRTDPAGAELAKYASNAFLAVKASFAHGLATLCEHAGTDMADVAAVMGLDDRIGPSFLSPGPGWGGPCLPKDTHALRHAAREAGVAMPLLDAALRSNDARREQVRDSVRDAAGHPLRGARIGLLGLAFKAGTADVRDSPALAVAERLAMDGAVLVGHDPAVSEKDLPDGCPVQLVDDAHLVAEDAVAVVVLTEWPQFRELDWRRMAATAGRAAVVDTRALLDPATVAAAGWTVRGGGRGRPS